MSAPWNPAEAAPERLAAATELARILVIEDEPGIVQFVCRALTEEGYGVESALDGARGLELALEGRHDLVLLDLLLPSVNGLQLLEEILERRPEQQIMVLSALCDVESKVRCLGLGASDFLAKPFELEELLARVHAQLRKRRGNHAEGTLRAGRVTLDLSRRTADAGAGHVSLSGREFRLFEYLMRKRDQVCTRDELRGGVWGTVSESGTNNVDVYVGRLRAKLGSDVIKTVRNVGYYVSA